MRPLRRFRRAKIRTRVLLGVLAVTLVALVAFDFAAVAALRGYLVSQTDVQLRGVLSLYQVADRPFPPPAATRTERAPLAGRALPPSLIGTPARQVISGPNLFLPGVLGRFEAVKVYGRKPTISIKAGPGLAPLVPADLAALARSQRAVTVPARDGSGEVRLMAEAFPRLGVVYVTTGLGDVNKTVGQLELILTIGSAIAGLVAAGGAAWIMRRGLRPIEAMAGQADAISAGDLTSRVSPHDPRTEIGRLSRAINGMLTRIEDFVAEREASQEAARRFFADASHELRTPLASLRANAELYQQGALPRRTQVDEAMRRIGLEAKRMGGLVDDMLRLARLDQHPAQQADPVDLTAIVTECVERAQTADPARNWHATVADGLEVTGDDELLRRAVDNVLANVTRHTPEDSTATIAATECDGRAVVTVSDDGPGVPSAQLGRIFERFHRAGAPSPHPGSGLGLAIVAAIAEGLGGSADAALCEPHGLRITLTLPTCRQKTAGQDRLQPPLQRQNGKGR